MTKIGKIGVQLYTIRDFMKTEDDIRESFKKLKAMGYDQAQTAGCVIPYDVFGKIAKAEGIEIVGTHDNFDMMYDDFEKVYQNQLHLGTKIMGIGGAYKTKFAECEEFVKKANVIAEKIAAKGGKFTYHHHNWEFAKLEGSDVITIEYLINNLDKDNVSFVLDTHWVQRGGGDVCAWIKKLSGRIDIIHLKDYKVLFGENMPATVDFAEIGQGNFDWYSIIDAAQEANVKYYIVEQDSCPGDPFESLEISSKYLHEHFM